MTALLLVDVQNDFLPPNGALAVGGGESILEVVYRLLDEGEWKLVVASQDYHPPGHISFASRHDLPPFTTSRVSLPAPRCGGEKEQELWPDHCVEKTTGAEFEVGMQKRLEQRKEAGGRMEVVRKGGDIDLDAYSAFATPLSAPHKDESPLGRLLEDSQITTLVVVGLATDYCVKASVLAALEAAKKAEHGWEVLVVREGVRGVFAEKEEETLAALAEAGAKVVSVEGKELQAFWRSR